MKEKKDTGGEKEIPCPNPKCHRRVRFLASGYAKTRCECRKWVLWDFDNGCAYLIEAERKKE